MVKSCISFLFTLGYYNTKREKEKKKKKEEKRKNPLQAATLSSLSSLWSTQDFWTALNLNLVGLWVGMIKVHHSRQPPSPGSSQSEGLLKQQKIVLLWIILKLDQCKSDFYRFIYTGAQETWKGNFTVYKSLSLEWTFCTLMYTKCLCFRNHHLKHSYYISSIL